MTNAVSVNTSTMKPNPSPPDTRVEGEETAGPPPAEPKRRSRGKKKTEPQALTAGDHQALGMLWAAAHAAGFGDTPETYVELLRQQVEAFDKLQGS